MAESPQKFFNFEYFKLWQEVALLSYLKLPQVGKKEIQNNRILIVNPCLIGEFCASVPAIYDFIQRNPNKTIDLLVTPPLKKLAERIRGIGTVYATSSVYKRGREIEGHVNPSGPYEKIIALRISPRAFKMINDLETSEIETGLKRALKYLMELSKNWMHGEIPQQWRIINFEMLGGKDKNISFEEMFEFKSEDQLKFEAVTEINSNSKSKIIVHTGTNWPMKHWPLDNWIELINQINKAGNYEFYFIGSDEDVADYEYISQNLSFKVVSLIKKLDLVDLVLFMRQANLFIGIDSGPGNLAHLADLRSIVLYGPGPHMYMSHHPQDIAIDKTGGRGVRQLFFKSQNSYINKIKPQEVFEAFQKII